MVVVPGTIVVSAMSRPIDFQIPGTMRTRRPESSDDIVTVSHDTTYIYIMHAASISDATTRTTL